MSQIKVSNVSFSYEDIYDPIFKNLNMKIDTDWKLGFIGRNGRGKTTFLKLLLGQNEYTGTITASVDFDYFPYNIENTDENTLVIMKNIIAPFIEWERIMQECMNSEKLEDIKKYGEIQELYYLHDGYNIEEFIQKEIKKLELREDVLTRPFATLSNGERTKAMLAALFLKKNNFLLIDEPTNHLDLQGREILSNYLNSKKSFILVSHDRVFLDGCIDHVLSINRNTIDIIKGNYTTWFEKKGLEDRYELEQNEKLKKEIFHLKVSKERTAKWSDQVESSKIGIHSPDRGRVGHLAAKMMKRSKAIEKRQDHSIKEKEQLLKNIDTSKELKINVLDAPKDKLLFVEDLTISYDNRIIFEHLGFSVSKGERVVLKGRNGCGKSSLIKAVLGGNIDYKGIIWKMNKLAISYISQDTSYLKGGLKEFAYKNDINMTSFLTVLQQLDFPRNQFDKEIQNFSEGQRKKVLIAKSLVEPSHLFIWDEPLNYIDILSRIQIENLIVKYKPTMLFIEHDKSFVNQIKTKAVILDY